MRLDRYRAHLIDWTKSVPAWAEEPERNPHVTWTDQPKLAARSKDEEMSLEELGELLG